VWLFKDLHLAGWPLLLGLLLEGFGGRVWVWQRLPAGWRVHVKTVGLERVRLACLVALQVCVAAVLIYVVLAFFRTAMNEWVESGVVAIARFWVRGGEVYPDAAGLKKFGVFPYGPLLFQVVGAVFVAAGRSVKAVKAFYIFWAFLTYGLMFFVTWRRGVAVAAAALAVEMLAVVVGIMGFMVKADIMLIFVSVACLAVLAFGRDQLRIGVVLAVLAGVAFDIKVHGVFYVLPAAVECLAMRPGRRVAKVLGAGAIAAVVAAAPFLVPRTGVLDYLNVLWIAARDEVLFGIFLSNVAFIGMCVAGVHMLVAPAARDAVYWRLVVSVLVAGFFVSVFAAKVEAGPHHLLPLLPYLCVPLGRAFEQRFDARRAVLFGLFLVAFQPVTSVVGDVFLMVEHWGAVRALI